jgi:hypothetical protein
MTPAPGNQSRIRHQATDRLRFKAKYGVRRSVREVEESLYSTAIL